MTITKTKLANFLFWAGVIATLCGGSAVFYEIFNESRNMFWPSNLLLLGGVLICGYLLITPNKADRDDRKTSRYAHAQPSSWAAAEVGGGFRAQDRAEYEMRKLGSTWLPFLKGDSTEQNMTGVTDRMNELIAENDLQVINVETVYRTNWLGRAVEPCGLRVWWLHEAPPTVQPLWDQVNT